MESDWILPWLTHQELADISLTCNTLHLLTRSITFHRSLDASRSFKNHPIPFHNTVDQHPNTYFLYSPSQIIPTSTPSLNRQFWGPDSKQSPVFFESGYSDPEVGCECEKVSEDNVIGCPCMELEREEGMGIMSECGPSYGCGLECGNRMSQRGIRVELKIVRGVRKGWGLYAAQLIQQGQFVYEYSSNLRFCSKLNFF